MSPDGLSWWLEEVGMVVGAQSISAVSTVSTVSSEQWAASPTLETECSANFYISEYFTNYLFNIRDISR